MDEASRKLIEQVRAQGGDIEPAELPRRWLEYLADEAERHGLLDDGLRHLRVLYTQLKDRVYLDDALRLTTHPELLSELEAWVDELDSTNLAGAIAGVFVGHQLAESWLADLLSRIRFVIDLRLGTYRVDHPSLDGKNVTWLCGQITQYLGLSSRTQLIASAQNLNGIRNQLAHELLANDSVQTLRDLCERFLGEFARLRTHIEAANDEMFDTIKEFSKWSDNFEDEYEGRLLRLLRGSGKEHLDRKTFARREGLVFE